MKFIYNSVRVFKLDPIFSDETIYEIHIFTMFLGIEDDQNTNGNRTSTYTIKDVSETGKNGGTYEPWC